MSHNLTELWVMYDDDGYKLYETQYKRESDYGPWKKTCDIEQEVFTSKEQAERALLKYKSKYESQGKIVESYGKIFPPKKKKVNDPFDFSGSRP